MKIEIMQKTTLEVLSKEPLKVKAGVSIWVGNDRVDLTTTADSPEKLAAFFEGNLSQIGEFGIEHLNGFICEAIFEGKSDEKPRA